MNTVTSVKDNNENAIDLYGKENLFCVIWEIKKRQTDYIITKMGLGGPSLAYRPPGSAIDGRNKPEKLNEDRLNSKLQTYMDYFKFILINLQSCGLLHCPVHH
jgi:hypothetical protein